MCLTATPRIGSRRMSSRRARSYCWGVTASSRGTHDPEADAVSVGIGRHLVPIRAPQHPDVLVHTRSPPHYPHAAGLGTARITAFADAVVVAGVPVGPPFPDVARHVV